MEPGDEEQFTAFVDLLGFGEAVSKGDEITQSKVLSLLLMLSQLQGEFNVDSVAKEFGIGRIIGCVANRIH